MEGANQSCRARQTTKGHLRGGLFLFVVSGLGVRFSVDLPKAKDKVRKIRQERIFMQSRSDKPRRGESQGWDE